MQAGCSRRDVSQAESSARQQDRYGAPTASAYHAGSSLFDPYTDITGYARPASATSKQLRHVVSLQERRRSSASILSGTSKLQLAPALTRGQLAEEKHIQRQSSTSDLRSSQTRPMSAERSRPSSARLRSSRESLSGESSSIALKRLSSADRLQSGAAEILQLGGNWSRDNVSRSGSRRASPGPRLQTIPAYNPSYGRSSLTNSNPSFPSTSTTSLTTSVPSFYDSNPSAPLRRASTGIPSAPHPYSTQATSHWGMPQSATKKKQSGAIPEDSGPQDFLATLQRKVSIAECSSLPSQPGGSPSATRGSLSEQIRTGMASISGRICSMTSPQRRTSPSPASAAEPDSHSFAEEQRRNGAAADGLVPRRQLSRYSSSGSLNAPVAGSNAFRDPGHISIPEKAEDTHKPYTYDSFEQPAASDHNARSSGDAVETRSEAQSLLAAEEEAGCGHQANTKSQPSNQHLTTSDSRQQSRDAGYVRVDRQGSKTLRQREHHAVGLDKSAGAQPPVSTSSSFSSYGGLHPGGDAKPIAGTAQHEQFELPSSSSGHAQSSYSADAQLESPAKSVLRHESTSECAGRDSVNVRLTQIHNSLRKSSAHPKPGVQKLRMGSGLDSEPQKSTELFRSTEPRATAGSSPQPEPAPAQHKSSGQRSAAGAAAGTSLLSPDTGLADQGNDMRYQGVHQGSYHFVSELQDVEHSAAPSSAAANHRAEEAAAEAAAEAPADDKHMVSAKLSPADAPPGSAHTKAESHSLDCESAHMSAKSPAVTEQLTAAAALPTEARRVAAQLAVSVTVPIDGDRHSTSASSSPSQGIPQCRTHSTLPLGSSSASQSPPQASSQHPDAATSDLSSASHPYSPANTPMQSCSYQGGFQQPSPSPGLTTQLAGYTPELNEAIKLSLSQDFQNGLFRNSQGHAEPEVDPEQPTTSQSPSRQHSGASSELRQAIQLSMSHESLPAESTSDPHDEPSSQQHFTSDPRVSSQLTSVSPSSSLDSSAASDASDSTDYADPVYPEEEARHTAPPSPCSPQASAPVAFSNPHGAAPSGHNVDGPALHSASAGHAANSPSAGGEGSLGTAPNSSTPEPAGSSHPLSMTDPEAGPSAAAPPQPLPSYSPGHASSSGRTTPTPVHTSSSTKPPKPSPGTAAQIDGDAALAQKLQDLELEENPEAADAVAEAAAEATTEATPMDADDDIDLAALQDVEVPLVGDQLPLAALVEDYEGSPRVCGNLMPLMQRFPYFRRIRGDGNCFYRAFIVAVMEDLCLNRSRAKCERLFGVFQKQKALLQAWQGINNAYYDQVRRGYYLLKELLTVFVTVGHGVDLEGLAKHMCQADVDGPIVHFLRAVTAAELCEKEEHYKTFIPGIDAYGGLSMFEIVYQAVLPMRAEVEHLQVKALVATLPVRLKILDVAGSVASIYIFEPGLTEKSAAGAAAEASCSPSSSRQSTETGVQRLWLIYRPGHYEVVYPESGSANLEKL